MPLTASDYVKEVNQLSEELLRSHSDLLERKNIRRKPQLIRAIKLDLDKLTHALVEVKDNCARSVLGAFFGEARLRESDICERLADRHIYHVGFQIHEPMDLVLHGIHHWIEQSQRVLGANMKVRDYLRFPASPAFQKRVGAYTEIMRIWLQVDERTLMLELFDIHRPADSVLAAAPRLTHRNFHGLFRYDNTAHEHEQRLARLFEADEIWHYALYVKSPADVRDLHAQGHALAACDARYFLPYGSPVHNQHDGSFHTKIVQQSRPEGARLEIEFVTQYAESAAVASANRRA